MPDDPAATDLLSALEREVQGLRTAQAEADRERAAIVLERAAIDAERASWLQERDQLVAECRRLEMQSAQERTLREQAAAVAEQERLTYERVYQQQLARRSLRHRLGRLAHRSKLVRRLRAGG